MNVFHIETAVLTVVLTAVFDNITVGDEWTGAVSVILKYPWKPPVIV